MILATNTRLCVQLCHNMLCLVSTRSARRLLSPDIFPLNRRFGSLGLVHLASIHGYLQCVASSIRGQIMAAADSNALTRIIAPVDCRTRVLAVDLHRCHRRVFVFPALWTSLELPLVISFRVAFCSDLVSAGSFMGPCVNYRSRRRHGLVQGANVRGNNRRCLLHL